AIGLADLVVAVFVAIAAGKVALVGYVQHDPLQRKRAARNNRLLRVPLAACNDVGLLQLRQRRLDVIYVMAGVPKQVGQLLLGPILLAHSIDNRAADVVEREDRSTRNKIQKSGAGGFKGMVFPQPVG